MQNLKNRQRKGNFYFEGEELPKGGQKEYAELKELLSPSEYEDARETVNTAFYTSPAITQAVYGALEKFGFKKGSILDIKMRYLIQTLYTENWKKGRNKGFRYNEVYESPYLISGKSKTLNAGRIYLNPPHVGLNPF